MSQQYLSEALLEESRQPKMTIKKYFRIAEKLKSRKNLKTVHKEHKLTKSPRRVFLIIYANVLQ